MRELEPESSRMVPSLPLKSHFHALTMGASPPNTPNRPSLRMGSATLCATLCWPLGGGREGLLAAVARVQSEVELCAPTARTPCPRTSRRSMSIPAACDLRQSAVEDLGEIGRASRRG